MMLLADLTHDIIAPLLELKLFWMTNTPTGVFDIIAPLLELKLEGFPSFEGQQIDIIAPLLELKLLFLHCHTIMTILI